MKNQLAVWAAACVALVCTSGSRAEDHAPAHDIELRILEIEIGSLLDVYADVFREVHQLRAGSVHLQLEANDENAEEIERERHRIERGTQMMNQYLEELRHDIHKRAQVLQKISEEQRHHREVMEREERDANRRRMEEMKMREHEHMQMRRQREEAMYDREQREMRRQRENEERQRREREVRMERRERGVEFEPHGEVDSAEKEHEVEVKVFVNGQQIEVEVEDEFEEPDDE